MAKSHPIPPFPPDIDRDAFGHWLSGFTDGEGCFKLTWHRHYRTKTYFEIPGATFELGLRFDDRAILEQIRSFWGVGNLHLQKRKQPGSNALARYVVSSAPELAGVLVPHFDRHPLRAKKARDFAIWKQGVELLCAVYLRPRIGRVDGIKGMLPKWSDSDRRQFADLFAKLRKVRQCAVV